MPGKPCYKILSIDGGGIRGIIPSAVLMEVERQIRSVRGDDTLKIGECFDLIAGTSTGGILSLLMLTPDGDNAGRARFGAADALNLYMENGDEIFDRSVWQKIHSIGGWADEKYSADTIERVAGRYFGDWKLSDLVGECLITTYDTKKYQPFFFTRHDAIKTAARNFYVRDAARATSAAPTYFQAALPESLDDIPNANPMVDGGVFANNPAACALVEAMKIQRPNLVPLEQFAILSIGTGRHPKKLTYGEIKNWGLAAWARPIIDILMEGNAQTVDYQLRTMFQSLGREENYLRIDGDFGDTRNGLDIEGLDGRLDNASNENMKKLRTFGMQLGANFQQPIQKFVNSFLN